jgi:hypothetical protein
MTTVSQLITDAYQYNNIVALSVIPSAAEQAKALRYLNRIFKGVFGQELGSDLETWTLDDRGLHPSSGDSFRIGYDWSKYLPSNTRVVVSLSKAGTLVLPKLSSDGARFAVQGDFSSNPLTVNANGRKIESTSSVTLNTDNTNSEWFFRSDLGNWSKVSDLGLTDDFPLPTEFEEYFIMMLAMRLGASEDIDLNSQLAYVLKDVTKRFKSRYRQTYQIGSDLGLLNLTNSWYTHSLNTVRFENG